MDSGLVTKHLQGCKQINKRSYIWSADKDDHPHTLSELITWPAPSWLDSSVGRTQHQYRRGHGFESNPSLNLFQALNSIVSCLSYVYNCEDHSWLYNLLVCAIILIPVEWHSDWTRTIPYWWRHCRKPRTGSDWLMLVFEVLHPSNVQSATNVDVCRVTSSEWNLLGHIFTHVLFRLV